MPVLRFPYLVLASLGLMANSACCQDRDALRRIVQNECVYHWRNDQNPAPCRQVTLPTADSLVAGYAILPDRKGGAHFLLIPTQTISGLESPTLIEANAPNYFAAAWKASDVIATQIGHPPPRNALGLAVNPPHARTQDQFHIHIECVRPDVIDLLRTNQKKILERWTPITLQGWSYYIRRIRSSALQEVDPLRLLADQLPIPGTSLADYTVVVVGASTHEAAEFVELVSTGPAGELLLDSTCTAVARSSSQ